MSIPHSNGFHKDDIDEEIYERIDAPLDAPNDVPELSGESVEGVIDVDSPEEIARVRALLVPARKSMEDAGFYAYNTFDQQQRLTVASDDEMGRFDIWVEGDDFVITLWASSPGLFVEEENQWKRRAMERLARMTLPRVSQGMLASHQEAMWDEDDHGIAVRLTYRLPVDEALHVGLFVRQHIPELDELLEFVERQIAA
jgi:hypothetical protein